MKTFIVTFTVYCLNIPLGSHTLVKNLSSVSKLLNFIKKAETGLKNIYFGLAGNGYTEGIRIDNPKTIERIIEQTLKNSQLDLIRPATSISITHQILETLPED